MVVGKTGSAEDGRKGLTHSWFVCFAPAENPRIAMAVMAENAGHGGEIAVPIERSMRPTTLGASGNTYAITASVSDLAGNPATPDTNNHMVVNIAPPDVPTVVPQYSGTTTPVITGVAQKLNGANAIALAAGDKIDITLNGVTVSATIQASGTATDIAGVTYDPATQTWSLNTSAVPHFSALSDGTHSLSAVATDVAGNASPIPAVQSLVIQNTAPPAIRIVTLLDDTGIIGGILTGDLGTALTNKADIAKSIGSKLGNTLFLAGSAAVIAVPLAIWGWLR